MEKRRLGRTGHMSTVVVFGGVALAPLDQDTANETMDMVLARGVNHIDIAPSYGESEARLGPWLEHHRDEFFLGCKTGERERDSAWAELRHSMERLRTDVLDLYQLHAVTLFEELDKVFAPGGAIEALVRAREEGLTRYLGITGHGLQAPAVHAEALERFDFDTVMFPINPNLYANPDYRRDAERLLRIAAERNVGVMIIKSVARQPWGEREKTYHCWYEPYDIPEKVAEGMHFVLSQPAVAAIVSAGDARLLPAILEAGESFRPMNADTQAAVVEEWAALEPIFPG